MQICVPREGLFVSEHFVAFRTLEHVFGRGVLTGLVTFKEFWTPEALPANLTGVGCFPGVLPLVPDAVPNVVKMGVAKFAGVATLLGMHFGVVLEKSFAAEDHLVANVTCGGSAVF